LRWGKLEIEVGDCEDEAANRIEKIEEMDLNTYLMFA
jgi:hypothetical protein